MFCFGTEFSLVSKALSLPRNTSNLALKVSNLTWKLCTFSEIFARFNTICIAVLPLHHIHTITVRGTTRIILTCADFQFFCCSFYNFFKVLKTSLPEVYIRAYKTFNTPPKEKHRLSRKHTKQFHWTTYDEVFLGGL